MCFMKENLVSNRKMRGRNSEIVCHLGRNAGECDYRAKRVTPSKCMGRDSSLHYIPLSLSLGTNVLQSVVL